MDKKTERVEQECRRAFGVRPIPPLASSIASEHKHMFVGTPANNPQPRSDAGDDPQTRDQKAGGIKV